MSEIGHNEVNHYPIVPETQVLRRRVEDWVYPSMGDSRQASEPSLTDVLLLLGKNWRTVALTILVALILGSIYCFLERPRYTAVATLELRTAPSGIPGERPEFDARDSAKEEKYLQTQVAKLTRLNVANYVLKSRGIGERLRHHQLEAQGWLGRLWGRIAGPFLSKESESVSKDQYDYSENFLRRYLRLLKTGPVFGTSLVEVAATTPDPALSRDIANAQVDGFIEFDRGERRDQILQTLSFLQGQADDLREKVAASERGLAQYAQDKELLTLSNQESVVVREIGDLTRLLSDATGKRIHFETLLHQVGNNPIETSTVLDDESIRAQRVELKHAEAQYSELANRAGPAYPPLQELRTKTTALKGNIREQRKQALTALQIQHQSSLEAEQKLRRQVDERKQAAFRDSRDLVRYNIMLREYESLKDLYQSILRKLKEDQVSSTSKGSNMGVANYAIVPERPSSPNIPLVLAVSLAMGLVLGCGKVGVSSFFNHTVASPDEASKELRLPMLGVVPLFPLRDGNTPKVSLLPKMSPPAASERGDGDLDERFVTINMSAASASEAFRAVRTTILLSTSDKHPQVILVASPQPGEGKTTVASNLAVTLAQAQHRTLLVDADLRKGKLGKRFRLPSEQAGLADYVAGETSDLSQTLVSAGVDNLDIMTVGRTNVGAAELVSSPEMSDLIAALRERYDFILLDSPPILPLADALVLSRLADGVVVVVRSSVTNKRLAERAIERLRQVRARVLGLVVNGFDIERNREYGGYEGL